MALDQNGKEFLDHVFTGVDALLAAGASVAPGKISNLYITSHSVVMNSVRNGVGGMNRYQAIGKAVGDTVELIGIGKLGEIFGLGYKVRVWLDVGGSVTVNEAAEFSPVGDAFSYAFDTYVRNADEFYTRLATDDGYRKDVKETLSSMFSAGYYKEVKEYYSTVTFDQFWEDIKGVFAPPPASGQGSLVYVEQHESNRTSIVIQTTDDDKNKKAAIESAVKHDQIEKLTINNHTTKVVHPSTNLQLRNALYAIDDYQFLLNAWIADKEWIGRNQVNNTGYRRRAA